MSEDDNDKVDPTKAIPEEVITETPYQMAVRKEGASGDDLVGTDFGDADTDRFDFIEGHRAPRDAGELPTELIFRLKKRARPSVLYRTHP